MAAAGAAPGPSARPTAPKGHGCGRMGQPPPPAPLQVLPARPTTPSTPRARPRAALCEGLAAGHAG